MILRVLLNAGKKRFKVKKFDSRLSSAAMYKNHFCQEKTMKPFLFINDLKQKISKQND